MGERNDLHLYRSFMIKYGIKLKEIYTTYARSKKNATNDKKNK